MRDLPSERIGNSAESVVRLLMRQPRVVPEEVIVEEQPEPLPVVEEPLPVNTSEAETSIQTPVIVVDQIPDEEETPPDVSTARLMWMRENMTQRVPIPPREEPGPTRLGESRPYSEPQNWQPYTGAEAVAPFDNTFNGMVLPDKAEVVDQWQASDGSQNVIVESPTGHRLCGRRERSDPMRPYVENLMQFHVCGGDGAIPFKFKPKAPRNRDFIDPVAKDATPP